MTGTCLSPDATRDGVLADRAWREGDTAAAIEAADRALSTGDDPGCLAAGVAAAAAAADGALFDAAARWRAVASTVDGPAAAQAAGRAALAAALAGDVDAATRDLAAAHQLLPGAAPRGLTVLLDGVTAALDAIGGNFDIAARRLAGLAVATVPADPMASERWDDLATTVMVCGGDNTARAVLAAHAERVQTPRRRLLAAWLDLRAGRLAEARAALAGAGDTQILRRDAVLAAAITVGLARRSGDTDALRATWHRVAPVVAGADVEPLLLDAWGELSVGAALVSSLDADTVVAAMAAAAAKAGAPAWGMATLAWWLLQRSVATADVTVAALATTDLATIADGDDRFRLRADAARVWSSILAGTVDPTAARASAEALATAGHVWEAAALCGAAAGAQSDPGATKELLSAGRAMRATFPTEERRNGNGLSKRECSVGELLLDGLTQKEIGARLYISPKTVEQHVARLRQKLMASNRAELIAALRTRLS